jgi:hypothetical protein
MLLETRRLPMAAMSIEHWRFMQHNELPLTEILGNSKA